MLEKILHMKQDQFIMEIKNQKKEFMEMHLQKILKNLKMKELKQHLFLGLMIKKIKFF